jgi:hypothetical protein
LVVSSESKHRLEVFGTVARDLDVMLNEGAPGAREDREAMVVLVRGGEAMAHEATAGTKVDLLPAVKQLV